MRLRACAGLALAAVVVVGGAWLTRRAPATFAPPQPREAASPTAPGAPAPAVKPFNEARLALATRTLAPTTALAPAEPAHGRLTADELRVAFAAACASGDGEQHAFAWRELLPLLVAHDAALAARTVLDIEDEAVRQEALDCVARLWAARDPAAAWRWADALPFADERETALTGVCLALATQSVPEAVTALARAVPGERPLAALADLTHRWAEADLAAAEAWALATPPGERRDALVARVAFVQANAAPAAAADLVVAELPVGGARDEAVIAVVHRWARRDAPAARAWVAGLTAGPLRDRAVHELGAVALSVAGLSP